jgi:hypothetical protein
VKCRLSGKSNRTIDCGWTLDFGALDWTDTSMALREFVSNAIDWAGLCEGEPSVTVVDSIRNKGGFTRIFVDYDNQDVKLFHRDLGKTFLHFSGNPDAVNQRFLPKSSESVGPIIFREGVKVRTLQSPFPAAFDYNFKKGEIEIDECRNSSEYALRAQIARAINTADSETLAIYFGKMSQGKVYEAGLDDYYLSLLTGDEQKESWKEGWRKFAGNAVIANETMGSGLIAEHAAAKGHRVITVNSDAFAKVAQTMGVPNMASVLGTSAAEGRIECEPTAAALDAVDRTWSWLSELEMTNGRGKPEVKSFRELMDGEASTMGFYEHGTNVVNLREDLGGDLALKVAVEEIAHYVTGAHDGSRDFQNYFIGALVEVCK